MTFLDIPFQGPAACIIKVGAAEIEPIELYGLIMQVEIKTARTEASGGTLVFEDRRKEDGRWTVADSGVFSRWEKISIIADFTTHSEEVFRGFVKALKPNFPENAGEATFTVEVQDESIALDREHIRTVWGVEKPITDNTILTDLVSSIGLEAHPDNGDGGASRSLAQDSTTIKFLRERAKANGYELIFSKGQVYFGPSRLNGTPQSPITVYAGKASNCFSFQVEDEAHMPDAVQIDVASPQTGAETNSETVTNALPNLGDSPAAAEGADLPNFAWRLSREGDEPEEQMRMRAQGLADINAMKLKATGVLDGSRYGHVLRVGGTVIVDGTGDRYGGLHYTDQVLHSFSKDGYKQAFRLLRNATGEGNALAVSSPLAAASSAIGGLFAAGGLAR